MKPSFAERFPSLTFAALSLAVLGLVDLLLQTGERAFERFLGTLPPLAVFAGVAMVGGTLLATVLGRAGFAVIRRGGGVGWLRALIAAAIFGALVIAADFLIVFPRDLNVPFPRSVLFYPAIGFLVEVVFHVVPLSVLLAPLPFIKGTMRRARLVYGALIATALLEPAYQILLPVSSWGRAAVAFLSVHVLAFNTVELWLFRRYDFVTMFGFRLLYYLVWHVAWGALRLDMLF